MRKVGIMVAWLLIIIVPTKNSNRVFARFRRSFESPKAQRELIVTWTRMVPPQMISVLRKLFQRLKVLNVSGMLAHRKALGRSFGG